ncbi:O-succinylhomoserine sulfhydrylase [compost metagenome]
MCPVKLYLGNDLTPEEQARAQIKDSTVRFAVGIEHVDDLIADIAGALRKTFA